MINVHLRDATEGTRQRECVIWASVLLESTSLGGRTHLKAVLKHYFMKFKLLKFSDFDYWFACQQKGTEQVEDRKVIFFFIK